MLSAITVGFSCATPEHEVPASVSAPMRTVSLVPTTSSWSSSKCESALWYTPWDSSDRPRWYKYSADLGQSRCAVRKKGSASSGCCRRKYNKNGPQSQKHCGPYCHHGKRSRRQYLEKARAFTMHPISDQNSILYTIRSTEIIRRTQLQR